MRILSPITENQDITNKKYVDDLINGDILHYKGHLTSTDDLPSTGQPSAEIVEPSVSMYSSEFILGSSRANKTAFESRLSSDGKQYGIMLGSRYPQDSTVNFSGALRVCSDNENMILGIFPYITQRYGQYNYGKVALHVDASQEKPVLAYLDASNESSSYSSQVLFDDGTTQNVSSGTSYTFTKPFWVGFARTSKTNGYASLFTNITTPLRFHGAPQLKSGNGSSNFLDSDYSNLQTYKQLSISKNYADGYILFEVNDNYSLSFYEGEPSPDAIENNVYTVGDTYEIYRCNSQPQWEHWSYADLDSKQDALVSGTNIKTINNESILGSGNISISYEPTDVQINGTSIVSDDVANIVTNSAYNDSTNKIATMSDLPIDFFDAGIMIAKDSDLNDFTTIGKYYANSSATAQSLSHCPSTVNFVMFVIKRTNEISQIIMDLYGHIYTRHSTSSGLPDDWRAVPYDIRINNSSILSGGIANFVTNTAYNASSNKIATMSDVPTDTNDLTNGAGYITGINSSDVTTALGYTPYNSTNPNNYQTETQVDTKIANAITTTLNTPV